MINSKWNKILSKVTFCYQPIVNIKSGKTYGVEVFLRDFKESGGFYSIINFFDEAYSDGVLYQVDLHLRNKVLKEFSSTKIENLRLFYNLDYRIMSMPDFTKGNTDEMFTNLKMDKNLIFFEISERASLKDPMIVNNLLTRYKQEGFRVVVDNFASGISGFQLLYYPNCDFIKLDRLFINNISKDIKKRLFFSSIINMAHIMNIKVIASCVETIDEYYVCKDLGVDFIQGFFIDVPKQIDLVDDVYRKVKDLYKSDKRDGEANIIPKNKIDKITPLNIDASLEELFLYFKKNPDNHFAPIIDSYNNLLGAVFEKDIKVMSYSQYGMSLAKNTNIQSGLRRYMKDVVNVEITWSIDKVLDIYNTTNFDKTGIFITKNNEYYGFVDLNTLLELSYYRNIQMARDQNPLTKLPGNSQIEKYLNDVLSDDQSKVCQIVYFDFNDFKPFNDNYGFRQGDRAISVFADILKKEFLNKNDTFIGHVGGDDFFAGLGDCSYEEAFKIIHRIQKNFAFEASSLYSKEDRAKGFIQTKDRFGSVRKFPLLGVAAAIIEINGRVDKKDFDDILGIAKKTSKMFDYPVGVSLFKGK